MLDKHRRISIIPTYLVNEQLLQHSICNYLDSDRAIPPTVLVNIREKADPDLLLLVHLVARDRPARQRDLDRAESSQSVDPRLDELLVERVLQRA